MTAYLRVNARGDADRRVTLEFAVERLARELHRNKHEGQGAISEWDTLSDDYRSVFTSQARELLTALFEPARV